jgi:hypothetical protein
MPYYKVTKLSLNINYLCIEMTIDQVHKFVDFLIRQSNSGVYVSPSEVDLVLNRAQVQYFNKLYGNQNDYRYDRPVPKIAYAITEKISDSLSPFLSNKIVVSIPGSGRVSKSSIDRFYHMVALSNTIINSPGKIGYIALNNPGSGYSSVPTVTIPAPINAGTTAVGTAVLSNTTNGYVSSITISNQGTNYTSLPVISISAPTAFTFSGTSSAVNISTDTITFSSAHPFNTGDKVKYSNGGGTSITAAGLVNNGYIYLIKTGAQTVQLSGSYDSAIAGSAINITAVGTGTQSFTGETATATAIGVSQEEYEITRVEQDRLANNLASYYDYPDDSGAIYTVFRDYIQFNPNNLYSANVVYLKKPQDMYWGYTIVNGRPVYSEALSVQPEWNDTDMNEIIYLALSYIGLNTKDADVAGFANNKTQTGL